AGGRDHDVACLQARRLKARQLAGIGEYPFRLWYPFRSQHGRHPLDEHDLVTVIDQLGRDGPSHVAGSGNGDPHGQCPPSDVPPAILATASAMASVTSMNTWSPSWMTVEAVGSVPTPKRMMYAARVPVASSSSLSFRPIQSWFTTTSMIETVLVGSRHSSVFASGTSWRSMRSAVHRTVATVGMPSRS